MNIKKNNINLLPPQALIKTGEVDYAEWNYKPILSYLQRKRFKLCLSLFEERKFNRVLTQQGRLFVEFRHCQPETELVPYVSGVRLLIRPVLRTLDE